MTAAPIRIDAAVARRLALARQRLAGPRPDGDAEGILRLVRELGCVQLDPISVVERTHLIVLWSRLGSYDRAVLDRLLWEDRSLFEYWAHAASIVPTSDYALHEATLMRRFARGENPWMKRLRGWMEANRKLSRHILRELGRRGPLPSRELALPGTVPWRSSGWTEGQDVTRMLDLLWGQGKVLVAGRTGAARLWDLPERCLPPGVVDAPRLSVAEATRIGAERSLRGLGVGTERHIADHFIRKRYQNLRAALRGLERDGTIVAVEVAEDGAEPWPGTWYIHADDLALAERIADGDWQPRTALLSPFDNLIADRARTELLFGYRFRIEIYVPKAKRVHGYYVLTLVHDDRLAARIDPAFDRKTRRLTVNAVHAEPEAPGEAGPSLAQAVEELAAFLGAEEIAYPADVPKPWRKALR
ncbi:MAG TPA: crosslink repair DNA glycosylase YcaQ family protein [Gaiellaceae bacterium]